MTERLRLNIYTLLVGIVLASLLACQRPITIVTPQGKVAYAANEVLIRVQNLQKATISAEVSGALPTAVARVIILYTTESAKLLAVTDAGWGPAVTILWGDAKRQIPLRYLNDPAIAAAVGALDVMLAVFLPPGGAQ